MKRILLMICLMAGLFLAAPVCAHAAETVASGSCGPSLNWILTDDGTLTISGSGVMTSHDYWDEYSFSSYKSQITSIVIEDGVTSVGNRAFVSYSNVTSLSLPASLINIGESAFSDTCSFLTFLRLPEGLKTIGARAFSGCASLVTLYLPSTLINIGDSVFQGCSKLVSVTSYASVPPTCGRSVFYSLSSVLSRIIVPEGTADAYRSASGWSTYSGFIIDGLLDPSPFSVITSYEGQTIYIDSGDSINFYLIADGVNGDVTADWYINDQLFQSDDLQYIDNDTAIEAWKYTPSGDGTRILHAVVKNTIGSTSLSVTTGTVTVVVGQGTGSGSTDSDRFDHIDSELTAIQDQLDDIQSGGSAGEDLSYRSDQLADDFAGIDEFEQSQMDILDSGMVQIKDSVSYTSFIPALAFVQRYADMTFDSIFDISIIFYLPMFLGLFFFLCSRVPYNIKDVGPKEKKNSIGFRYDK